MFNLHENNPIVQLWHVNLKIHLFEILAVSLYI